MSEQVTVFYAWQSDTSSATNRNAIRSSLALAAADVERAIPGLTIVMDEATRNMVGADNVPDFIRQKIAAADIFVGDVTTVTTLPGENGKPDRALPNPNVTFEVGYATAHLGWTREILLINTAIAKHGELPFDFDRQRVSAYSVASAGDKQGLEKLRKLLVEALTVIIVANPAKAVDAKALSPSELRRKRDIQATKNAMSLFCVPVMTSIINDLPYKIETDKLYFYENFTAYVLDASFHINDPALSDAFHGLAQSWVAAFQPSHRYHASQSRQAFFSNPGDSPLTLEQQADWDQVDAARREMAKQLDTLLEIIRRNYVEIDISQLSDEAYRVWRATMERLDRQFSPKDGE